MPAQQPRALAKALEHLIRQRREFDIVPVNRGQTVNNQTEVDLSAKKTARRRIAGLRVLHQSERRAQIQAVAAHGPSFVV